MGKRALMTLLGLGFCLALPAAGQTPSAPTGATAPQRDSALAASLGADERGMKSYVLVVLKTGPTRVPDGVARTKMFEGHFANIKRMAAEKKLVLAGPLDGADGWRGMYIFNTPEIAVARTWVATDPVITSGEMVADYHKFYGSAALMTVNDVHDKIRR